ncbi:general transcription factor II-I repeat domain-containing protein 2A-like [Frankliniella occidentalis]|uniref:General transcription factor II-I repeat domain-containing protein 2A-like n=1 Tax=Frankliniella occidentalis TaxID=133901 RepID=A0A9C6XU28_FRAOC|nr:general transcription factor II-I repeat domain-containing protein 2A-like [Frankliniella occidentalis]
MSFSKPKPSNAGEDAPPPKLRKVDRENRTFQMRWEEEYFFTLDPETDKPVCLVCREPCSVKKEFNLRRHYTRIHENYQTSSMIIEHHQTSSENQQNIIRHQQTSSERQRTSLKIIRTLGDTNRHHHHQSLSEHHQT